VAVQRAVEDLLDQMRDVAEPTRVVRVDKEMGMAYLDIGSSDGIAPGTAFLIETPPAEGGPPQTVAGVAESRGFLATPGALRLLPREPPGAPPRRSLDNPRLFP
jgi:hypothetical protein